MKSGKSSQESNGGCGATLCEIGVTDHAGECDAKGRQHPRHKVVAHPRGTGGHVLTNADIVGKYRSLTHSVISPDRQFAIEKIVLNPEGLDDISELMALLTPTVRSPFD